MSWHKQSGRNLEKSVTSYIAENLSSLKQIKISGDFYKELKCVTENVSLRLQGPESDLVQVPWDSLSSLINQIKNLEVSGEVNRAHDVRGSEEAASRLIRSLCVAAASGRQVNPQPPSTAASERQGGQGSPTETFQAAGSLLVQLAEWSQLGSRGSDARLWSFNPALEFLSRMAALEALGAAFLEALQLSLLPLGGIVTDAGRQSLTKALHAALESLLAAPPQLLSAAAGSASNAEASKFLHAASQVIANVSTALAVKAPDGLSKKQELSALAAIATAIQAGLAPGPRSYKSTQCATPSRLASSLATSTPPASLSKAPKNVTGDGAVPSPSLLPSSAPTTSPFLSNRNDISSFEGKGSPMVVVADEGTSSPDDVAVAKALLYASLIQTMTSIIDSWAIVSPSSSSSAASQRPGPLLKAPGSPFSASTSANAIRTGPPSSSSSPSLSTELSASLGPLMDCLRRLLTYGLWRQGGSDAIGGSGGNGAKPQTPGARASRSGSVVTGVTTDGSDSDRTSSYQAGLRPDSSNEKRQAIAEKEQPVSLAVPPGTPSRTVRNGGVQICDSDTSGERAASTHNHSRIVTPVSPSDHLIGSAPSKRSYRPPHKRESLGSTPDGATSGKAATSAAGRLVSSVASTMQDGSASESGYMSGRSQGRSCFDEASGSSVPRTLFGQPLSAGSDRDLQSADDSDSSVRSRGAGGRPDSRRGSMSGTFEAAQRPDFRTVALRVRLAALVCLQALAKNDPKALHPYWPALFPCLSLPPGITAYGPGSPLNPLIGGGVMGGGSSFASVMLSQLSPRPLVPNLATVLLYDPSHKVRALAAVTMAVCLEGPAQRMHLSMACAPQEPQHSMLAPPAAAVARDGPKVSSLSPSSDVTHSSYSAIPSNQTSSSSEKDTYLNSRRIGGSAATAATGGGLPIATSVRGFLPLSQLLSQMVTGLHASLLMSLSRECIAGVLTPALRALCVLTIAAPFDKLSPDLLLKSVEVLRLRWALILAVSPSPLSVSHVAGLLASAGIDPPPSQTVKQTPAAVPPPGSIVMSHADVSGIYPAYLACLAETLLHKGLNPEALPRVLGGLGARALCLRRNREVAAAAGAATSLPALAFAFAREISIGGGASPLLPIPLADSGISVVAADLVLELFAAARAGGEGLPATTRIDALAALRGLAANHVELLPLRGSWLLLRVVLRTNLEVSCQTMPPPSPTDMKAVQMALRLTHQALTSWGVQRHVRVMSSTGEENGDLQGTDELSLSHTCQAPFGGSAAAAAVVDSRPDGGADGEADATGAARADGGDVDELYGCWREVVPLLLSTACQHASPMVRAAAFGIVGDIPTPLLENHHKPLDEAQRILSLLNTSATQDPVPSVRAAACKALARLGPFAFIRALFPGSCEFRDPDHIDRVPAGGSGLEGRYRRGRASQSEFPPSFVLEDRAGRKQPRCPDEVIDSEAVDVAIDVCTSIASSASDSVISVRIAGAWSLASLCASAPSWMPSFRSRCASLPASSSENDHDSACRVAVGEESSTSRPAASNTRQPAPVQQERGNSREGVATPQSPRGFRLSQGALDRQHLDACPSSLAAPRPSCPCCWTVGADGSYRPQVSGGLPADADGVVVCRTGENAGGGGGRRHSRNEDSRQLARHQVETAIVARLCRTALLNVADVDKVKASGVRALGQLLSLLPINCPLLTAELEHSVRGEDLSAPIRNCGASFTPRAGSAVGVYSTEQKQPAENATAFTDGSAAVAADLGLREWLRRAVEALAQCMDSTTLEGLKVQWNACYALACLFRNAPLVSLLQSAAKADTNSGSALKFNATSLGASSSSAVFAPASSAFDPESPGSRIVEGNEEQGEPGERSAGGGREGPLRRDRDGQAPPVPPLDVLVRKLVQLVRDSNNFKVRTHAAIALSALDTAAPGPEMSPCLRGALSEIQEVLQSLQGPTSFESTPGSHFHIHESMILSREEAKQGRSPSPPLLPPPQPSPTLKAAAVGTATTSARCEASQLKLRAGLPPPSLEASNSRGPSSYVSERSKVLSLTATETTRLSPSEGRREAAATADSLALHSNESIPYTLPIYFISTASPTTSSPRKVVALDTPSALCVVSDAVSHPVTTDSAVPALRSTPDFQYRTRLVAALQAAEARLRHCLKRQAGWAK